MPLEFVSLAFDDTASTSAVQRRFMDFPMRPKRLCLIKQVQWHLTDIQLVSTNFDISFGMSLDPDDDGANFGTAPDSRKFITDRFVKTTQTNVGYQILHSLRTYHFPEGLTCVYGRLPVFIQHSNTGAASANHHVRVYFEFLKVSTEDIAIATVRRGRGVGRRIT